MSLQMLVANEVFAINKFDDVENSHKLIGKYRKWLKIRKLSKTLKLSKSKNLKGEKLFKSQKLTKLGKKLLKSGNLSNFDIKKNKLRFLILNAGIIFNCL